MSCVLPCMKFNVFLFQYKNNLLITSFISTINVYHGFFGSYISICVYFYYFNFFTLSMHQWYMYTKRHVMCLLQ